MTAPAMHPAITVALAGGPLDGGTHTTDRIVFPLSPRGRVSMPGRWYHPDDGPERPVFPTAHYHRTARTDAAGRVVYEYRG